MTRRARAPRRRTAPLAAACAVALAAPVAVVALSSAPAVADDPCLEETNHPGSIPGLTTVACDDATPPVTDLPTASPAPTVFGYTKATSLTFTFHGHYTDADADPLSYQYQFWNADNQAAPDPSTGAWTTATGDTVTIDKLADSTTAAYHFRARAVDAGDSQITRIPHTEFGPITDTPDLDTSFDEASQEITFRIDTAAPNTFITDQPVDEETPDRRAIATDFLPLSLDYFDNSGAIIGFACALDGARVPCAQGSVMLSKLVPGKHTFVATSVDRAGNVDPVPARTTFWSPRNLTLAMGGTGVSATGSSCTRLLKAAYVGGDVINCTRVGDQLHFPAPGPKTREIRLIAPAGPRMGVVEINVGEGRWIPVDLYAKTPQLQKVYLVRDPYEPPKGGQVRVRVKTLTPARPYVRVDAVMARN